MSTRKRKKKSSIQDVAFKTIPPNEKARILSYLKSREIPSKYSGNTKTLYVPEKYHEEIVDKFGMGLTIKLGILDVSRQSQHSLNPYKNKPLFKTAN